MSYFLDDDASQIRDLKDKLEKLQSDFLSTQFSVSLENIDSGQNTIPLSNPSSRGGAGMGGSASVDPLFHTITTVTPVTLPTKTNIDSSLSNVFKITLDRNIEFDIINPNATKFEMLHIVITQDAGTARTITWPGSVNGTPTIDATLGSETTVSLFNMGDGTWRFVSTRGGVVGFSGNLNGLTDVTIVAPNDGEYLRFGGSVWSESELLWADINFTGSSLDDLADTLIGTPSANTVLKWSGTAWVDGNVVNANIDAGAAIDISKLNITGTPDGTKFLRDDNTWAVPSAIGSSITEGDSKAVIVDVGTGRLDFFFDGLVTKKLTMDAADFFPESDGTYSLGKDTNAWSKIFSEEYRIEIGGGSGNRNQIFSNSGGPVYNAITGGRHEFIVGPAVNGVALEEDRIQFLTTSRQHRIDATLTSINIIAENTTDGVELWPGSSRSNEGLIVQDANSIFKNNTTGSAYQLLIQYSNATTTGQPAIGNIGFQAEDSANVQSAYAGIVTAIDDDTSTSRDGRMQLVVASGHGTGARSVTDISPVIDIQGGNGSEKLGFFGTTPVVQQTVASDTLANLYTALRNSGIIG